MWPFSVSLATDKNRNQMDRSPHNNPVSVHVCVFVYARERLKVGDYIIIENGIIPVYIHVV